MTKPDPIMIAVANFNNWYNKEIAKSKRKKLKNVTPPKPKNTWHKGKVERVLGKNEELL
jgi:hypothetical protein|tara:strand:- start:204 stop:380 length:177 start_codon:yes stop_codon:yes gene_type:complete